MRKTRRVSLNMCLAFVIILGFGICASADTIVFWESHLPGIKTNSMLGLDDVAVTLSDFMVVSDQPYDIFISITSFFSIQGNVLASAFDAIVTDYEGTWQKFKEELKIVVTFQGS